MRNLIESVKKTEIAFDKDQSTEFQAIVKDNVGQISTRSFIIHPQANMTPQIRITSPAKRSSNCFRIFQYFGWCHCN
jgi:hypothetical protein